MRVITTEANDICATLNITSRARAPPPVLRQLELDFPSA
ncbi:MAG: hypothetical protein ACI9KE_004985 [Polyangiales bacterium]|jgi:hypothetical protein